jgi:hypothetical protein
VPPVIIAAPLQAAPEPPYPTPSSRSHCSRLSMKQRRRIVVPRPDAAEGRGSSPAITHCLCSSPMTKNRLGRFLVSRLSHRAKPHPVWSSLARHREISGELCAQAWCRRVRPTAPPPLAGNAAIHRPSHCQRLRLEHQNNPSFCYIRASRSKINVQILMNIHAPMDQPP